MQKLSFCSKKNLIVSLGIVAGFLIIVSIFLLTRLERVERHIVKIESSVRQQKVLRISGGEKEPLFFKELIVSPYKVKNGDIQKFSIWVKDKDKVKSVIAELQTDRGIKEVPLSLKEGTANAGKWAGKWKVNDVSSGKLYLITFEAENFKGKKSKIISSWYGK